MHHTPHAVSSLSRSEGVVHHPPCCVLRFHGATAFALPPYCFIRIVSPHIVIFYLTERPRLHHPPCCFVRVVSPYVVFFRFSSLGVQSVIVDDGIVLPYGLIGGESLTERQPIQFSLAFL